MLSQPRHSQSRKEKNQIVEETKEAKRVQIAENLLGSKENSIQKISNISECFIKVRERKKELMSLFR
jgi:hypothetical protein